MELFAHGDQLEESEDLICQMNIKPIALHSSAVQFLGLVAYMGIRLLKKLVTKHLFIMEPENSVVLAITCAVVSL